ncbi:ATL2 [Symbiodinium pilosum]|uniref:ATL2 protein n=1 Tax=Symbiodinium pilosum TaxID=2952 RepID=A0A812IY54_SYMPI|nr:ATL2 [Symbiodinium pilosum]
MAVASIGACLALQHHSSRRVRGTHVVLRRASQVEAVRLVSVKEGQLVVDQTNLALLMESLRASSCERVAVVSIAGALRQGKSFFLDLFARYLESSEDMLSGSLQDSQRFCWKSGMERVTDGVWACPQVFEGPGSAKTRVGILLLDTQGTYEPGASRWQNNSLLGLAGSLSSILLFNVSKQLQQDTVQDLQVAMDLLKMSCRHHGRPRPPSDSKTLTFLVRDWAHGQQLNEGQNQSPKELPMTSQEQSILESFIHSTTEGQGLGQFFESLECRTLPHPGHIDRPSWTGDAKEISDDFLVGCRGLFCTLATMASAQTGAAVTVQDFEQTLQEYIAVLNSARDLTESGTSHRQALSDVSLLSAFDRSRACYRASLYRAGALTWKARLPEILSGEVAGAKALVAEELVAAHRKAMEEAAQELRRSALFGDAWA